MSTIVKSYVVKEVAGGSVDFGWLLKWYRRLVT